MITTRLHVPEGLRNGVDEGVWVGGAGGGAVVVEVGRGDGDMGVVRCWSGYDDVDEDEEQSHYGTTYFHQANFVICIDFRYFVQTNYQSSYSYRGLN